jgi:signal transduction histidine kinase
MTIQEAAAAFGYSPDALAAASLARGRIDEPPPTESGQALLIANGIAATLGKPAADVRVKMVERSPIDRGAKGIERVAIVNPGGAGPRRIESSPSGDLVVSKLLGALPIPLAPFAAAVRQADGSWTEIRPLEPFLASWQARVLLAMALSALLAIPLAWWTARAVTRPIRLFSQAAERIGLNYSAEPLKVAGPRELRSAAITINSMQDRLRGYIQERTAMVGAIAHDLRTPLTGLRLTAEQAPDETRERLVTDIRRMETMISQALSFVRGETVREQRELVDLMALAASCADEAEDRGAAISIGARPCLPVLGEPLNLSRAISNLIENAIAYAGAVELEGRIETDHAVLLVRDRGAGVPEEELERVFEPFHRGEPSRSRDTGGVGLGLTSARTIARNHGGDLGLRNRAGGGLEARLTIPLAEQPEQPCPSADA